jgi:nucleotide-binding universal stress UspA family protein
MYKHLLVAVDGSKLSQKAVAHAIALAKPLKAKITVFYAAPEPPLPVYSEGVVYHPMPAKAYAAAMAKEADRILAPVVARATKAGVVTEMRHAIAGAPWEAIIDGAKKSKCDADRHGLARPARRRGPAARQRDPEGADARQAARDRRPLAQRKRARIKALHLQSPRCARPRSTSSPRRKPPPKRTSSARS